MLAMQRGSSVRTPFGRLFTHVPPGQLLRFIAVGVWNTVFGYATFALLAFLFERDHPKYGYIAAGAISSALNISVAFLGYKWFVFKTKGHYLREWARCVAVYSSSIVLGLILLPILVLAIRHATDLDRSAPFLAGAVLAVANALYNFVGNKKYTFRTTAATVGDGLELERDAES